MSVFGSIVSAIFGSKHAASVTAAAGSSAPSAGSAKGTSASSPSTAPAAGTSAPSAGTSAAAATKPISKADVEAISVLRVLSFSASLRAIGGRLFSACVISGPILL